VSGDGNNKPKGFLAYSTIANASWSWGNIGYVPSGAAGAFPSENPSDVLVDLIYALRSGYRQNATFVMNRKTQSSVRKFKAWAGVYLWQPPAVAGGKSSLIGFPLLEAEDMPDVAAGSLSIAFGDFRRGYLIVDRQGVRVLRDPYSAKPYVLHDQAGGRRRAGLRCDQTAEVCGELRGGRSVRAMCRRPPLPVSAIAVVAAKLLAANKQLRRHTIVAVVVGNLRRAEITVNLNWSSARRRISSNLVERRGFDGQVTPAASERCRLRHLTMAIARSAREIGGCRRQRHSSSDAGEGELAQHDGHSF
jgi:hypothetical protein